MKKLKSEETFRYATVPFSEYLKKVCAELTTSISATIKAFERGSTTFTHDSVGLCIKDINSLVVKYQNNFITGLPEF